MKLFLRTVTFLFALFISYVNNAQLPAGYYAEAINKSCADLKTALRNITGNGYQQRSYDDLWAQFKSTDIKPREVGSGSAMVIWDIYSDNPTGTDPYNFTPGTSQCGNYNSEADCYNREHSVPQSWFNESTTPSSDYNHIFPTDGYVNGRRSNYPYGEVASATWTSNNGSKLGQSAVAGISGTVFEPIDEYKGDVARAFFYFVTRYQENIPSWSTNDNANKAFNNNTFPSVNIDYLKLMLKWNAEDPVSDKERARNEGTYSFQHNRNPFIDSPQYVNRVWNSNCPGLGALPVDILYFGGKLNGSQVLLNWIVENELNLDYYEVQRSVNGVDYTPIARINATNSSHYTYTDTVEKLNGRRLYYRLQKTDKDGSYTYSSVWSIHVPAYSNNTFLLHPNPATNIVNLQLNQTYNGNVLIYITDFTGRKLITGNFMATNGMINAIDIHTLRAGSYIMVAVLNNGYKQTQKLVVVK